jgi:endonuclease/exonuclease/phosphatase family metal-dependent hydrolase
MGRADGGSASDALQVAQEIEVPTVSSPSVAQIASINMQSGHGAAAWNLQVVAEDAELMKLDIICMQETKITNKKHASRAGNFDIIASESSTNNQGGVAFFIRRSTDGLEYGWSCEDPKIYDTKVVVVKFVLGKFRRRLVGVYLSPREIEDVTWDGMQRACEEATDPIWFLGDFNVDLQSSQASWGCDNFAHTKIQRRSTGVWTWRLRRSIDGESITIKSVCDYILGPKTDPVTLFHTRRTTNIRMDHRMIYVDLKLRPAEHMEYLRGRKRFPFLKGPTSDVDREYLELLSLQAELNVDRRKQQPGWISDDTWKCIQLKNCVYHDQPSETRMRRKSQLKRHIRRLLKRDRMKRMEEEAELIEQAMAGNDTKMGFQALQKWHKRRGGVKLPMSHKQLTRVSDEWTELYGWRTMPRPMFSLDASIAMHFEVRDDALTNDELRQAGKRMKKGKQGRVNFNPTQSGNGQWANQGQKMQSASRNYPICARKYSSTATSRNR